MGKDKTLATFQIDKSKWSKFKRLTGNQSASAVLVQFIEKFLDNPNVLEKSEQAKLKTTEYESITDSRIKALEDRLTILESSDIQTAGNLAIQSITNLENRFKELEDKFSIIEKSNTESVINSAIQSITNLETGYKELKNKLTIIESSNIESVNNLDSESINNLESDPPTENINKEELEKKVISQEERNKKVSVALEQAESELRKLESKVIKKQIYQRAAELLNQWKVLDKSSNQGQWSWTKVRDYFKK